MRVFHVGDNAADGIHQLVNSFAVDEPGRDDGVVIFIRGEIDLYPVMAFNDADDVMNGRGTEIEVSICPGQGFSGFYVGCRDGAGRGFIGELLVRFQFDDAFRRILGQTNMAPLLRVAVTRSESK